MFLHTMEDGHVLVRMPRSFAAWRVDGKHLDYLRRTRLHLYAPLALLLLGMALRGPALLVTLLAAVAWGAWKGLALMRWLADNGERVAYKTVPLRWYERQLVMAAIAAFAGILFVTIKMAAK